MQLLPLLLILAIFMHDGLTRGAGVPPAHEGWMLACLWLGGPALVGLAYWMCCRGAMAGFRRRSAPRRVLRRLDLCSLGHRYLLVGVYLYLIQAGALTWLRVGMGEWILLDELVFIAPTMLGLLGAWWAYYPIERRLRDAALIGRMDAGLPVYPLLRRGGYILNQARHQLALTMAPLLLILGWAQIVDRYGPEYWQAGGFDPRPAMLFAGAAVVFLTAPLLIRHLWDTTPLPAGELRGALEAMCRRHRVRVRELLLWRTFGGMINAAVMGVFGPLRYILLTDALLELVRREQVEAVMAHELAHVRRHHMFWLLVTAIGTIGLFEAAAMLALARLHPPMLGPQPLVAHAGLGLEAIPPAVLIGGVLFIAAMGWLWLFGWISRRIERQADAFAVQDRVWQRPEPMRDAEGRVVIDHDSAATMVQALQQVADLNHIPPEKRSWRHGSIAWRQAYLWSLIGQPAEALAIDRQIRWIKAGAAGALAASVLIHAAFWMG